MNIERTLAKAERYLDQYVFFSEYAQKYRSASRELSVERSAWLKVLTGLVIKKDTFQDRIAAYDRMADRCLYRAMAYLRKHDKLVNRLEKKGGVVVQGALERIDYQVIRASEELFRLEMERNGR